MVQQGGKHQTQIVADSTERGWPQRIHILSVKELGGPGGGGLDLLITLIKSGHSDLFLLD